MQKRIVDLSPHELDSAASDAWRDAAKKALARGLAITGSRDGRRLRYYPDGHVEDLGPVASIDDDGADTNQKTYSDRRSIA